MREGCFGGRFGGEGAREEESIDRRFLDEFCSVFGGVAEPGDRSTGLFSVRTCVMSTSANTRMKENFRRTSERTESTTVLRASGILRDRSSVISELGGCLDEKSVRLAVYDGGRADSHSMTDEIDRIGEFLSEEVRELVLGCPFLSDEMLRDEGGGPVDGSSSSKAGPGEDVDRSIFRRHQSAVLVKITESCSRRG